MVDGLILNQADVARPCRVCRGKGVCACEGGVTERTVGSITSQVIIGCNARYLETIAAEVGPGIAFHAGKTCHNCLGVGTRPHGVTPLYQRTAARSERRAFIREHLETVGSICPGFGRLSHRVDPSDLTADHRRPRALGGQPTGRSNLAVLCRSCNARKGMRVRSTPSRSRRPMLSVHKCDDRCDAELHVSEIVILGSISREVAQRYLRQTHGRPALFVEALSVSVESTEGRRVELRDDVSRVALPSGLQQAPPLPMVWVAIWRR